MEPSYIKYCAFNECGKPFIPSHGNQKYCEECRKKETLNQEVKEKTKKESIQKTIYRRICASRFCSNEFETLMESKIYCCSKCQQRESRVQYKRTKIKDIQVDKICANEECKKSFQDHRKNVIYCPDCSPRGSQRNTFLMEKIEVLQQRDTHLTRMQMNSVLRNKYPEMFEYAYEKLNANFPVDLKDECLTRFLDFNKAGTKAFDVAFLFIHEYSRLKCKTKIPFNVVRKYLQYRYKSKTLRKKIRESVNSCLQSCSISDLVIKNVVRFFKVREDLAWMQDLCQRLAGLVQDKMQGRAPYLRAMICIYFILEKMKDGSIDTTQRAMITQDELCFVFEQMGFTLTQVTIRNYLKEFGLFLESTYQEMLTTLGGT